MTETAESQSREWTTEEVREKFLTHVWHMIEYWNSPNLPETRTTKDRLTGLAFSILSTLDGSSFEIPGFIVAPCPHPSDKQFHRERGGNWYPENDQDKINGDIGGGLHELFYGCQPEHMKIGDKGGESASD